ncbi:HXXEE domain-containing protein [Paenibacillus tarimensis]|uniref:HXXEE domain-containing protein n=1 Tax=Paenibacillus tarimensis TaxID=416012 RepID=UPI001F39136F|nr:HXXEE domain-containing protein [Paenibacillus tarimensis]MCF2946362.1 HXXEE domain-containing protein [Paenibacillus tarimensis]
MEIHNLIWLFVVVFMLHDFEEIISVEKWAKQTEEYIRLKRNRLSAWIWNFWNVNSYNFAKRDVVIFTVMSVIVFLRAHFAESPWSAVLFISFLIVVLAHNAVHLLQTVVLGKYTPGLYTAVFLVTPYTTYLLYHIL